ncbi:MAG: hypothetical protein HY758_07520 [Nitrospirae bacterium]|nr:hypothetical protein [Nitrospirota bacterium]
MRRSQQPQGVGWGVIYNSHESYYEKAEMSFKAQGVIKKADGTEIKFSLKLKMSYEYMSQTDISLRAGDAVKVDPLVVNFGGSAAELTDTKFAFDLDSDGENENISFVGQGSGMLALDYNNDGAINDGSELFGPQTGNGFAELSAYDGDGNKWIDENDEVYLKLKIWTKDSEGNDILNSLKEKGVGAIYLASADSAFDIKDSGNNLNGQVARTGIYLNDDGTGGTIQQVDMVA